MTLLHKLLKKTFFIFLSILLVVTLMIFGRGYLSYQHIVHDIPIEQKIDTIRKSPNYTPLKEVNPYFKNAIYAVEDCRFYQHGAIDPIGLVRAMSSNIKRRKWREGGSTITQQLAKNMFFSYKDKGTRKIPEFFIAKELERQLTKDEILELYINIIYFGEGHYGIREASYGYFGKSPSDLNLNEASLLAGLPQSPSMLSLNKHYSRAKTRQKHVLQAMYRNKLISKEELEQVFATKNNRKKQ